MYKTSGLFFLFVFPVLLIIAAKICIWGRGRMEEHGIAKTAVLILVLTAFIVPLTGCWDRVEIENRAFVVAIGIDKAEENDKNERYTVTLSVPILGQGDVGEAQPHGGQTDEKNDDDKIPPPHVKTASGSTITQALKALDAKTDKQLYYGQAKLLVLGESLLEGAELVDGVINLFTNKQEIDCRMHILAAENAYKILTVTPPGETLPGLYVSDIYRHKNKIGGTAFALDFERFSTSLTCSKQNGAIIPKLSTKNEELELHGAVVLKNRKKTGALTPEELKGYLWCFPGGGKGAIVTVGVNDESNHSKQIDIPMHVESHKVNVNFTKPPLQAEINVQIKGRIDECAKNNLTPEQRQNIETALAREISLEIAQTAFKLQYEFKIDGYNWLEHLRKKNYPLYKAYEENWNKTFTQMQIIPRVKVELIYSTPT